MQKPCNKIIREPYQGAKGNLMHTRNSPDPVNAHPQSPDLSANPAFPGRDSRSGTAGASMLRPTLVFAACLAAVSFTDLGRLHLLLSYGMLATAGQGGEWLPVFTARQAVLLEIVQWLLITVAFAWVFRRQPRIHYLVPIALIAIALEAFLFETMAQACGLEFHFFPQQ